ncbi:hypothetical protein ASF64_02070 [Arthrobacter sp. Leaf137]|nr:hypothetical protein ASF64_02070 [Arthrobacter sp. Leaf137]
MQGELLPGLAGQGRAETEAVDAGAAVPSVCGAGTLAVAVAGVAAFAAGAARRNPVVSMAAQVSTVLPALRRESIPQDSAG